MPGPLSHVRVVEIAGLGPAPFAGMMLADQGAEVICVNSPREPAFDFGPKLLNRSKKHVVVDLKNPAGIQLLRDMVKSADGFIEGFRPGVMERLGLGPASLFTENPKLVYGRMTGWGQTGPYAQTPGHDINYLALSGTLHLLGRAGEQPTPPANLLGDFGGGGLLLAFGMLSAILHARSTGKGQVVDCAMVDGAALLSTLLWGFHARGHWRDQRGTNFLDTGSHFYDTYETADGRWMAVGALEPQFYSALRTLIGKELDPDFDAQMDRDQWPDLKAKLAVIFKQKTRDEWTRLFEGSVACVTPVLSMSEAPMHPHNIERATFMDIDGIVQPAPAPRYSATPSAAPIPFGKPDADRDIVLTELGYDESGIQRLKEQGVFG